MRSRRLVALFIPVGVCLLLTGCGGSSANAAASTVPGAPRAVYAVPHGNGGALLKWKAPTSDGGTAITGYVVTPYKAGVAQRRVTFKGATTTRVVKSLRNGKSYRFGVAARNATGWGAMSPRSAAIVVGAPGQPGKPTIDKRDRKFSTPLGPGEVFLEVARPARNAWRILHLDAKCRSSNGGKVRMQVLDFSEGPAAKVSSLTVGKTYRCTVTATNKFGTGRRSKPSKALAV
jgi:large repetitive protein